MNLKKYSILALMALVSSNAAAQTQVCADASPSEVIAGTLFGTLIRTSDCGGTPLFCIDSENGVDATTSNRFYATALTAQATGATLDIRFDFSQTCTGGFPQVLDLRLNAAAVN